MVGLAVLARAAQPSQPLTGKTCGLVTLWEGCSKADQFPELLAICSSPVPFATLFVHSAFRLLQAPSDLALKNRHKKLMIMLAVVEAEAGLGVQSRRPC